MTSMMIQEAKQPLALIATESNPNKNAPCLSDEKGEDVFLHF